MNPHPSARFKLPLRLIASLPLLALYLSAPPSCATAGNEADFKLEISPRSQYLLVYNAKGETINAFRPGTVQDEVGIPGKWLVVSYGKDSDGSSIVILRAKSNLGGPIQIHAFDQHITLSQDSQITIHPAANGATRFQAGFSGEVLLSGTKLEPNQPIAPPPFRVSQPSPSPSQIASHNRPATTSLPPPRITLKPSPQAPPATSRPSQDSLFIPPAETALDEPAIFSDLPTSNRLSTHSLLSEWNRSDTPASPPSTPSEPTRMIPLEQPPTKQSALEKTISKELGRRAYTWAFYHEILRVETALQHFFNELHSGKNPESIQPKLPNEPLPSPPDISSTPSNDTLTKIRAETNLMESMALDRIIQIRELRVQIDTLLKDKPDLLYKWTPFIPRDMRKLADQATEAFGQGRLDDAVQLYQTMLQTHPDSLHCLSNLGVILINQNKPAAASEALLKAVQIAPFDAFSYSVLGVAQYQSKQYEAALVSLLRAHALNPGDAETLNYLSLVASSNHWDETAETLLRQSIDINPKYAEAHHNLAVLYASQKPPALAMSRKHYQTALDNGARANPALEKILNAQP